ncbi:MAG TPA: hypothetical protein VEG38_05690 [Acidimicrobiia bacterium]|nr:hypothetical protein [Acidimicrobiia bacterium]
MQQTALPSDAGFVVDWQITDDNPVIDLSMAESEVILADTVTAGADLGLGSDR